MRDLLSPSGCGLSQLEKETLLAELFNIEVCLDLQTLSNLDGSSQLLLEIPPPSGCGFSQFE
jgi:hypothetical protein